MVGVARAVSGGCYGISNVLLGWLLPQVFRASFQLSDVVKTLIAKNPMIKPVSLRISKRLKVHLQVGGLWGKWASALNINAWSAKLAGQPKSLRHLQASYM